MGKKIVPSVVMADRDPTNCRLLHEICQACGWHFAGCAHGVQDTLALLARTRPDCLITEYKFAGSATGLDLIAQAKRLLPRLFTVMLTGWDINDVAAHVTAHQPDRILRKPVAPHTLMDLFDGVHSQVNVIRINAV